MPIYFHNPEEMFPSSVPKMRFFGEITHKKMEKLSRTQKKGSQKRQNAVGQNKIFGHFEIFVQILICCDSVWQT